MAGIEIAPPIESERVTLHDKATHRLNRPHRQLVPRRHAAAQWRTVAARRMTFLAPWRHIPAPRGAGALVSLLATLEHTPSRRPPGRERSLPLLAALP